MKYYAFIRPHTIKAPLYFWCFSREKKYQALHACTTSTMFTFQRVGAWEGGYKAVQLITPGNEILCIHRLKEIVEIQYKDAVFFSDYRLIKIINFYYET